MEKQGCPGVATFFDLKKCNVVANKQATKSKHINKTDSNDVLNRMKFHDFLQQEMGFV